VPLTLPLVAPVAPGSPPNLVRTIASLLPLKATLHHRAVAQALDVRLADALPARSRGEQPLTGAQKNQQTADNLNPVTSVLHRENGQLKVVTSGTSFDNITLIRLGVPPDLVATLTGQTLAQAQQDQTDFANGTLLAKQNNNSVIGSPRFNGIGGFANAGLDTGIYNAMVQQLAQYFANINNHGDWQNLAGQRPSAPAQQIAQVDFTGVTFATQPGVLMNTYTATMTTTSGGNQTAQYLLTVDVAISLTAYPALSLADITIANPDGSKPITIYSASKHMRVPQPQRSE